MYTYEINDNRCENCVNAFIYLLIFLCMYANTHTHTHTYIYIEIDR